MSAIITPPTHLLNWIVVGLAIICCKVCQNIALFLLISYLFAFLMQLLSHLNASVRVYNTASVKCYSFVPSSVLLFTSIVDENGHGNCYILSVYDFQLCWGTIVLIFVEDASIEKRHYTWIRKHVNKMALVSQCQLKVIPRSHVLQDKFLSLYILNVYCFFLMK